MKSKIAQRMSKQRSLIGLIPVLATAAVMVGACSFMLQARAGFDEFGYNYVAGIFEGPADGVDRVIDGAVWGDPTYANDHLVMKWSKGWDVARFEGGAWGPSAWEDNQWNGNVPGGSGEIWHCKIIWVGPDLESSIYWVDGGYPIWGQFEVIMEQGVLPGEGHVWSTHANPCGYGMN